ncbi:hypothetical protein L6E12_00725 [Actinokineospora sp. PR83]|uniref:hypothetical protein n=1 Tax=Actinokineospora sp. PR83 TaxID=2884908 RepID=UPI001F2D242A|nr:hypothetical protein [Actinokineospora sp. PR83]MCG8914321.1 hypothetical protein [Actinokineospora sp. PR83]
MLRKRPSPREIARDQLCALYEEIGYDSPVEQRLGLGLLAALLDLTDRLEIIGAPVDDTSR